MTMEIIISPGAEKRLGGKRLGGLPRLDQIAVAKKIRSLKEETGLLQEKLKGYKNIFKVRVGDCRIVYQRTGGQIYIVLIGHRKDIYRLFKQLFK